MPLSGTQMQRLTDALVAGFTRESLARMMTFRLEKQLAAIAFGADMVDLAFKVIETAEMEGWTGALIKAAHESNPQSPQLVAFVRAYGFASIPPAEAVAASDALSETNLERVVRARARFQDVSAFIGNLAELEPRICRVTYPIGRGKTVFGTGFLVGPDLLLTNDHVVDRLKNGVASPDAVECLFDYRKLPDDTEFPGTKYKLKTSEWLVDSSPVSDADLAVSAHEPGLNELDYALLRLSETVGEDPIGRNAEPGAPPRGWIEVREEPPQVAANDIAFVLQHPVGQHLKLAIGKVLGVNGNGTRVRYDVNTIGGSSGSPAFTADLKLFALHHSGDPNFDPDHKPKYNEGIPVGRIVSQMLERQIPQFWVNPQPVVVRTQ